MNIKMGNPEIRTRLGEPAKSTIKMVGTKKHPTLTTDASMSKNKMRIVKTAKAKKLKP